MGRLGEMRRWSTARRALAGGSAGRLGRDGVLLEDVEDAEPLEYDLVLVIVPQLCEGCEARIGLGVSRVVVVCFSSTCRCEWCV